MAGDLSSDAQVHIGNFSSFRLKFQHFHRRLQFYVATGVLSLLYCVFIIAVYAFIDELYKSKSEIPLADFMLTTILAIFWLSGSAAWSNGTNAFKGATDTTFLQTSCTGCTAWRSSFSRLNISLVSFVFCYFHIHQEPVRSISFQCNRIESLVHCSTDKFFVLSLNNFFLCLSVIPAAAQNILILSYLKC